MTTIKRLLVPFIIAILSIGIVGCSSQEDSDAKKMNMTNKEHENMEEK